MIFTLGQLFENFALKLYQYLGQGYEIHIISLFNDYLPISLLLGERYCG